MDSNSAPKSRKLRRKEARKEQQQNKHRAWLQRQNALKTSSEDTKPKNEKKLKISSALNSNERVQNEKSQSLGKKKFRDGLEVESKPLEKKSPTSSKRVKEKKSLKRKSKTKFEELLEMDMKGSDRLAKEDLNLERRLAKQLKVKDGKLADELDLLLEGIPSALGFFDDEGESDAADFGMHMSDGAEEYLDNMIRSDSLNSVSEAEETSSGNERINEDSPEAPSKKLLRRRNKSKKKQESDDNLSESAEYNESEAEENSSDHEGINENFPETPSKEQHRRKKKLQKNQESDDLSESDEFNDCESPPETSGKALVGMVSGKYVAPHLRACAGNESEEHTQIRRRVRGLLNRLSESNVESVTAEITTIFHSATRNIGTQIICDEVVTANSGGPRGNEQHAAVFAAFVAGMACSIGMDFGANLVASLAKVFEAEYLKDDNLSLRNTTLLLSYLCIFGVCSCDLIYDFLITLSKQLTEINVSTILTVLQCCGMKIRGDDPTSMKNFIQSVHNGVNELKASSKEGSDNINSKRMEFMLETILDIKNNKKKPQEETMQHTRIRKWLQKLGVDNIMIRGIKWNTLLDPNKKGQWWLSGEAVTSVDDIKEIASKIDRESLEAQKLLRLAASQRMNTEARRAIFCIIMSGEDYLDAFEKLLRLDLHGTQDREIMRVLVQCCLQEKVFNKYYTVLASKLCSHDKNHMFTLQFCIWDHFKELESMTLQRSVNLAKFIAEMVSSFTLSLSVLKIMDFSDPTQLTPKRIIHFRALFDAIFQLSDDQIWNLFTRIAIKPELEPLRDGVIFFIREHVLATNKSYNGKFKAAKKALNNTGGVLM